MSAWSDAFLEVAYSARRFAMAWDEANYSGVWANVKSRAELVRAKAQLEMDMAIYKAEAKRGIRK